MPHTAYATNAVPMKQTRSNAGRYALIKMCIHPSGTIIAFFLLSLAVCFKIPSPYALAAFCVLAMDKDHMPWAALGGIVIGVLFRALWGVDADYWQCAGAGILLFMRGKKESLPAACLWTGASLLPRFIYRVMTASTAEEPLLALLSVFLGIAAIPALLRFKKAGGEDADAQDHLLCRLFPLLILMMGASRLTAVYINFGWTAAAFFTLAVSGMLGSGAGICAGLLCGLPLALSGHNAVLMLCFSLSGMISGLFKQKKRGICALFFLMAMPVAQYVCMRCIGLSLLLSSILGGLIYVFIPRRALDLLCQKLWCLMNRSLYDSAYLQAELNRLSTSIARLSEALPEIETPQLNIKDEAERIAASLCVGCNQMTKCFHDEYEKTIDLLQRLASSGGYETVYHKVIQEGFLSCPRAENIPQLIEEMQARTDREQQQAISAKNEREMLKTHLCAISEQVERIKKRVQGASWSHGGMEGQVEDILYMLRLPARVLWAQRLDGQISIALTTDTPLFIKPPSDQLLRMLENRFGVPLYISASNGQKIMISQMPPVKLLSGFASITSSQSGGSDQSAPENGDAFLLREVTNGHLIIALSDGMGHGAQARRESKKTLEMLALCLSAGYSRDQAMKVVNGMMLSAAYDERYATVDLCMLDCWSGELTMNKLGACPSLLIQGRHIQKIEGDTLPLGILDHVIPMEHSFHMGNGDLLLLMTDGITDAFGGDDALNNVIYRVLNEPAQIIADTLLQEALTIVDHRPKDDMSVLCLKTLENEAARLPHRRAV